MPEWLFALILLGMICALGVYITKGIEGFRGFTGGSAGTPSSGRTTLNDLNTDFLQYAYSSLTKTPTSRRTNRNSPYLHAPTAQQLAAAQDGNGLSYDATPTQSMYESQTSYKGPWSTVSAAQGGTPISVHPSDFDTEAETIASCAPVRPALRDLIRSDMDEAVNGLVEKEVLQLQNKYALA